MNQIVQRQGAASPWVEIQAELEAAVTSFRAVLLQIWVRGAVRMLTLSWQPLHEHEHEPLLVDVRALRDREWETHERAYHDSVLKVADIKALVRMYNALAPYTMRRAYEESGEVIMQELRARRPLPGSSHNGETEV
jgi:DnaJ homolog subfamily C member 28